MSYYPRLRILRPVALTLAWCLALAALGSLSAAEASRITVQVDRPGARINPAMWGVFFEDINFGADGGLYAELVKNRSFEFPDHLMGWSTLRNSGSRGSVSVCDDTPFDAANPHYVWIAADSDLGIGIQQ